MAVGTSIWPLVRVFVVLGGSVDVVARERDGGASSRTARETEIRPDAGTPSDVNAA